jgi:hypothetical protein
MLVALRVEHNRNRKNERGTLQIEAQGELEHHFLNM